MWIVAGTLLGLALLTSLLGFRTGPHSHALAGGIGALAALWLVVMAINGRSSSLLWTLFSADVVLSGGVGVVAWKGLTGRRLRLSPALSTNVVGKQGIAVSDLSPQGVVRVKGENWSATSLNGTITTGAPVQVVGVSGIRLEVWGESNPLWSPVTEQGQRLSIDAFDLGDPPDHSTDERTTP